MASHQIAIAKASLAAGLLRPDPTSIARDDITALHNYLERALSHCSPANIQTCKSWLLRYVVSSSNRVSLLAKYLVALAGSLPSGQDGSAAPATPDTRTGPSAKRKRLHMLYLLNDLFHHTKYHNNSTAAFSTLSGSLQPHIVELLSYAASYDRQKHPKHHKRLDGLLDIWQQHSYFAEDFVSKLREVVINSAVSGPVKTSATAEENKVESGQKLFAGRDAPFVMPSTHGDLSTPYYDLPAGNLVPHIIPNSTIPLRPDSIKPLQFLAGPADGKLVTALKAFLKDVDLIYGSGSLEQNDDEVIDIDDLGQTVIRDTLTGDILQSDTYYGWSRLFCQQMKKRNTRHSSQSRSRSRSRSPARRRRYSDSLASDDSRYRSPRSRSRSPARRPYDSRSRSRSRTTSWRRSGSGSREKSYSPQPPGPPSMSGNNIPPPPLPQPYHHHHHHQPGNPYINAPPPPAPPSFPPLLHQMQFPPTGQHSFPPGMPVPPPPPSNYQGVWPPPPPAMPSYGGSPGGGMPPNFPPPFAPGGNSGQYPGQPMPPGSYHFPPPHQPGGGGRGSWQYPPGPPSGRGWR
ncbi:hypothetical protein P175DRAFT_0479715 [Aspergillus ochraceoroseus IBT 24754]|uniref:CID domain-containing protein n=2 Tax=Aspergillus ochraceoroseus TaxID=138278 RepID=A0A2T5LXQ5_9EURO|nr:uncharacterized protein P175DRAFT_0479715 [Aspergillus ochraceoroseus IBT 24754]KKK19168.1 hypothetical protein AOCH_003369 [Aspergillus ochraceoroseus]PTU21066.1 hypothetical protein P175DRAFT_0479715 [Aspergillus ochraceoroseus IBT 24754]